jgi:hypothetical protein
LVRSEQNSTKLRHAARDVYRRPLAFSRVHCVMRLKGVRRERVIRNGIGSDLQESIREQLPL